METGETFVRESSLKVESIMAKSGFLFPHIRLKGKWLEKLGYRVGSKVTVKACADAIVIMKGTAPVNSTTSRTTTGDKT